MNIFDKGSQHVKVWMIKINGLQEKNKNATKRSYVVSPISPYKCGHLQRFVVRKVNKLDRFYTLVENNNIVSVIKCGYFSFICIMFPENKLPPLESSIITDLGESVCTIMF